MSKNTFVRNIAEAYFCLLSISCQVLILLFDTTYLTPICFRIVSNSATTTSNKHIAMNQIIGFNTCF